MRPGNSTILSSLILARQHALIFAGRVVDVRERQPFRSADHDAMWFQEIEARLDDTPASVQKTLTSATSSSNGRSRRSKTHVE
jgi:hypothetical protein